MTKVEKYVVPKEITGVEVGTKMVWTTGEVVTPITVTVLAWVRGGLLIVVVVGTAALVVVVVSGHPPLQLVTVRVEVVKKVVK